MLLSGVPRCPDRRISMRKSLAVAAGVLLASGLLAIVSSFSPAYGVAGAPTAGTSCSTTGVVSHDMICVDRGAGPQWEPCNPPPTCVCPSPSLSPSKSPKPSPSRSRSPRPSHSPSHSPSRSPSGGGSGSGSGSGSGTGSGGGSGQAATPSPTSPDGPLVPITGGGAGLPVTGPGGVALGVGLVLVSVGGLLLLIARRRRVA
jgi:hypothetical protein